MDDLTISISDYIAQYSDTLYSVKKVDHIYQTLLQESHLSAITSKFNLPSTPLHNKQIDPQLFGYHCRYALWEKSKVKNKEKGQVCQSV